MDPMLMILLKVLGLTSPASPASVTAGAAGMRGGFQLPTAMQAPNKAGMTLLDAIKSMMEGGRGISNTPGGALAAPAGSALNALGLAPIPKDLIQQLLQQIQGPQG